MQSYVWPIDRQFHHRYSHHHHQRVNAMRQRQIQNLLPVDHLQISNKIVKKSTKKTHD